MYIKLKLLLMALCLSQAVSQTVIINEFLASNVTSNPEMVDFDDYSDWIAGNIGCKKLIYDYCL